jgi:Flp pilus assembly pilin Flp
MNRLIISEGHRDAHPKGSKIIMKKHLNKVMLFFQDVEGAASIEYALLASLIAAVIVIGVTAFGLAVKGSFEKEELLNSLGG